MAAPKRLKKIVLTIGGLVVVLGVIVGLKAMQIGSLLGFVSASEAAGMPPTPVATVVAIGETWEETLKFTGSLRAVQGVTLTAELPGTVVKLTVENGAEVKQGEILLELDTTQEQADLASALAGLRLAKINLDRTQGLLEKRIIAQSEYDTAVATFDQEQAKTATLQATIAKKIIRAPFTGRVGIRKVNLGQTVAAGDELIPLHSSDPIYVEFSVPQTQLDFIKVGQAVRVATDGVNEPVVGEITAINPVVDEATRSARVQGTLRNPDGRLRAGLFAEVEVVLPNKLDVVAVPISSILTAAYGDSIYVIEEKEGKMTARQQFVQLGRNRGDFVAVVKGLAAGDRVVSAGAFKLMNGALVSINDAMQPEASLDPTPDNR
ncbi:MAG: efflux RND transporter periplasmic adaptor subunit [Terrimicrobiaceae bacterium]